ncbi:hypothetical protein J4711_01345 [Staphylococcus epidermidis]|nr:hypothetical protein [Staphylococcus epidermidis]
MCHDVVWIDLIVVHLSESPTCRRRKVNNNITTGLDKENSNYKNQFFIDMHLIFNEIFAPYI